MAGRVILGIANPALSASGLVDRASALTFYENRTTIKQSVFSGADLLTPLSNPLSPDSAGRFPQVWAPDGSVYSVKWSPYGASPITYDDIAPVGNITETVTPEQYGAIGDGTTDDAAALNLMAAAGKRVMLGDKTYAIASGVTVPDGVSIYGTPGKSFIKNLNSSVSGFSMGGGNTVRGVGWLGHGSKDDDYHDTGLRFSGNGNNKLYELTFDNMSGPCIYGADVNDCDIDGVKITDSCGGTECVYDSENQEITASTLGSIGDIMFTSVDATFANIRIRNVTGRCKATSGSVVAKDMLVFIDSGAGDTTTGPYPRWYGATVENVVGTGYERGTVYMSAEYATENKFAAGRFVVSKCQSYDTGSIGIKVKAAHRIEVTDCIVENYELIGPETTVIGGGIHINNGADYIATDNNIAQPINDDGTSGAGVYSTNAINIIGLANGGEYANPYSTSNMIVANNNARGTLAHAFRVSGQSRNVSMGNNNALACIGHTLVAGDGTGGLDNNPSKVTISGGSYDGRDIGATTVQQAFSFSGVQNISITGVQSEGAGGNTMGIDNCTNVNVANCGLYNSGTHGTSGQDNGIAVSNTAGFTLTGTTSKNWNGGTTQVYGLFIGTGNSGPLTITGNGELSGSNGTVLGGTANIPTSGVTIANNNGLWTGTESWTPGEIATLDHATHDITVAGAKAGDYVKVVEPGSGQGCPFQGRVISDDTLRLRYDNPAASAITATGGDFLWTIERRN